MSKLELFGLNVIISAIIAWFSGIFAFVLALVTLELFDYATGIAAAHVRGEPVTSAESIAGITRKVSQWVLIIISGFIDMMAQTAFSYDHNYCAVTLLCVIWLITNEIISIFENLDDIGVPIPKFMRTLTHRFKDIVEDKGGELSGEESETAEGDVDQKQESGKIL